MAEAVSQVPHPRPPNDNVSTTLALACPGQDADYGEPVSRSDAVDRAAWAALLGELLDAAGLTAETAAAPRGPLALTPQTIYRWRNQGMGASVHQVRDVCRALGYPPAHGLVRVGFLTAEEAGIAGPAAVTGRDPLLRRLTHDLGSPNLPEAARAELRRQLTDAHQGWLRMLKALAQRPRE